jgi:serine/threonine-protein kinase
MMRSGTTLGGRYVLVKAIARGGMGEVWQADDTVLGRVVAVKILLSTLSGDPDFAARFRSEARAMASLSHPGIVEVYDYGDSDGLPYLVMRYVAGQSLRALLEQEGRLSPARTMNLVSQAAEALHHAHNAGIVHRDVKPGNLLIRPDGRLVLTDFGIARILAADLPTTAGQVVGTAAYLAPEQVLGAPVSPATDMYALGVVAYECLTLTRPFVADTAVAVALMHTRTSPPPLPSDIPVGVRDVVVRALAKDPAQRWARASDMAGAATAAADTAAIRMSFPPGEDESTTIDSLAPVRRRRPRRPWLLVAAAAGVVAAVGLTTLVALANPAPGRQAAGDPTAHMGSSPTRDSSPPVVVATATDLPSQTGSPSLSPSSGPVSQQGPVVNSLPLRTTPHRSPPVPSDPPTTSTSPGLVAVPAVLHQNVGYAQTLLENVGLVPEMVYSLVNSDCSVLDSTPAVGAQVAPGSVVTLTVDANTNGVCTNESLPP